MTKFKFFCILALAVFIAVPAYAEVQNIKISGDITARYLMRDDFDLDKNSGGSTTDDNADNYFMGTVEVQLDADLTDNVATVVRLVNQRDWDDVRADEASTVDYDLNLDLAYIELKELVYAPLTVTLGRQDLWFGKGFVVGAKQRDNEGSITASEYTAINSFDAIKASIDLDPWTVDLVFAEVEENVVNESDDVLLAGANVGYKFDSYNAEAELYMFGKYDRGRTAVRTGTTTVATQRNQVVTTGIRGSMDPLKDVNVFAELAIQTGRYSENVNASRKRDAMAYDLGATYAFDSVMWSPKLGLEYIYYSGEEDTTAAGTSKWSGWDPMYRGKFDSAIREFQNVYYNTALRGDNEATCIADQDSGVTNQKALYLIGSASPSDVVKLDGRFGFFWFDEQPASNRSDDEIGSELDLTLTYDYTEDVAFSVLAGWFFPGAYFPSGQDDTATEVVGTVSVSF